MGLRGARFIAAGVLAIVAAAGSAVAVGGTKEGGEAAASGMRLIANYSEGGTYRNGTDMAFWGDRLLLGNLDQGTGPNASPPGGFRLMDVSNPAKPQQLGKFVCSGDQSDVSIWEDLVIMSVDKPTRSLCDTGEADWEGLRFVSIADPARPKLLGALRTDCGSHTHTIVPDEANDRLIVYVLSYPLAGRYNPAQAMLAKCTAPQHGKISVVEVPLDDPAQAKVIGQPSVAPTIGCHDVTVFLERQLAAAACLTESQMWDISDPAKPEVVAHIPNPAGMDLSHSTTFSNDGRTLVIGAELGGAAASPGCLTANQDEPSAALFFYDVTGVRAGSPQLKGRFKIPQQRVNIFCTAHLFNVVPFPRGDDRDVLVSSWYTGATSVIDFTDPAKPKQIAFSIPDATTQPSEQPREAAAWASYWYRGHVFSNNFDEDVNSLSPRSRGLDVFAVDHPAVRGALPLRRLNPQVQEPLPGKPRETGASALPLR
jgi:hypothetical protein